MKLLAGEGGEERAETTVQGESHVQFLLLQLGELELTYVDG